MRNSATRPLIYVLCALALRATGAIGVLGGFALGRHMASNEKLEAFLRDVDELEQLARELRAVQERFETRARSMVPKYNPGADGFSALPRLRYEVGEILDGIVLDVTNEDDREARSTRVLLDDLFENLEDLRDVVEVAMRPRKKVTA